MKRRKIQIGLMVLIILMCCGINPKAWAVDYTWDGARWLRGTTETNLANIVAGDRLVIRENNADLGAAGLKQNVSPDVYFNPMGAQTVTLNVSEGITQLGNVSGIPNGHYILKAYAPTLNLGNVSISGGWLRLKHNTGGLGSGSINATQLLADNAGFIYVDTMSSTIGDAEDPGFTDPAAPTDADSVAAVVAANGGNVTFTIGNANNKITIQGSIVLGSDSAAISTATPAVDYLANSAVKYNVAAPSNWNSTTYATPWQTPIKLGDADCPTITTGGVYVDMGTVNVYGTPTTPTANDFDFETELGDVAAGNADTVLYRTTYTAEWIIQTTGALSATPGSVNVIGTGTAAASPESAPSFIVWGHIYMSHYLSGTYSSTYTQSGFAYEIWEEDSSASGTAAVSPGGSFSNGASRLATIVGQAPDSTYASATFAAGWTPGARTITGYTINTATNTDHLVSAGTFTCTNAALYVNALNSTAEAFAADTRGRGGLNFSGSEVHFGVYGINAKADSIKATTFAFLAAENVITDENTSFTYHGPAVSFPSIGAAGRTMGSLYFKDSVKFDATTLAIAGGAFTSVGPLTLAGNLETAKPLVDAPDTTFYGLDITGLGANTITVNGYVDLGSFYADSHKVAKGATLVFNGAIRGWGAGVFSVEGASDVADDLFGLTDVATSTIAAINAEFGNITLANLTIGVNGQENGDSVAALPETFTAVGNFTLNRASAELELLDRLTIVGNLTINAGTIKLGLRSDDSLLHANVRVLGETNIGRGGVLNLNIPDSTAAGAVGDIHHRLGTHDSIYNNLTVNGLLTFEGYNPTDTLTINGPIQPSQGTFQGNAHSVLILKGKQSYSLPATLRELMTLNYGIDTNKTAPTQVNTLTLQSDLIVDNLVNTSGILRLAGYKLTVKEVATLDSADTHLGKIDATNGSELDLATLTSGLASDAFRAIGLDETTDLTIRNFAWFVPIAAAAPALPSEFKVNNLSLISETPVGGTASANLAGDHVFTGKPGAILVLAADYANTASTVANAVNVEIMGNLNIINNDTIASFAGIAGAAESSALSKNLIVHGDLSVTNNNKTGVPTVPAVSGAVLALDSVSLSVYGQLALGGQYDSGAVFITDTATTLNILGESKRFEFPAKTSSYKFGKIVLNRPAGARFNNTKNDLTVANNTLGNAFTHFLGLPSATTEALVLDIQRGDLNLNGNNITFANPFDILQEIPGNTVINTGTSYFSVRVQLPTSDAAGTTAAALAAGASQPNVTRGAILAHYGVGTAVISVSDRQLTSIGVTGVEVDAKPLALAVADDYYAANVFDFQSNVRRYPKGVFVPDVGISAQRYYYIKPVAANTSEIEASYDQGEVVGTENTMKFYIETVDNVQPTSDAFSNAEQLLGTTQITPATVATAGKIKASRFEDGKSYDAVSGMLALAPNGYLLALAALPGGGGYKEWTGDVDSMWQVAGNWGPTPGAPGPRDQAIINRATGSIVITGTATCSDLLINADDILIRGQRTVGSTANAILRTTGNIYNYGLSSIKGVDGNNRLDLQVNDPTNPIPTGVLTNVISATETDGPNGSTGVWFDNVTVTTATLLPSDGMRISGNISLTGNSTMQQDPGERIVLYGPNTTAKTLTVPSGNAAVFGDIVLTNQANMTTASNLTLKGKFDFEDAASIWNSTDGTIYATYGSSSIASIDTTEVAVGDTSLTFHMEYTPQTVWNNPFNASFVVNNIQIGANLPKDTVMRPGTLAAAGGSGVDTYNYTFGKFAQPVGTITVAGKFDKIGNSVLEPLKTPYVSGGNGNYAVVFSSNRQTEISNGAGSVLRIPNLIVTPNTKLQTNSSFNISNHLEVQTNAEMLCNSGTITFDGKDEMVIINISDRTLVMNNVNIEGRVTTPSSWKLAGNLVVNRITTTDTAGTGWPLGTVLTESYFDQTAGTITIQNGGQSRRLIDNMATIASPNPNITFNKLAIDASSRLATGPQDATTADKYNTSFVIKNRAANGTMASGIELAAGSGYFNQPAIGTVYFQTDGTVLDTTSKWITNNSTPERMQFGNIFISPDNSKNSVKTKSSFEVLGADQAGVYGAEFLVAGGGASFEALEGTITFASEEEGNALISSLAPSKAQFANLRANNSVVLNIDNQTEIFVSENLIADDAASFIAGTADNPARVELNGITKAQHLAGTSTVETPFSFTRLLINKGATQGSNYTTAPYSDSTGVVVLDKNVEIVAGVAGNQSELILSRGVLNLNNSNFNVGANYITYQPGYSAIDGAAGSYVISSGHETKKLEDQMFTIAGSPTLYDLEVAADHQLANSLTVNNDLTLNGGILSLAPAGVAEVVEPKTLTLFGDLIQTSGTLASGSVAPSVTPADGSIDNTLTRLILKGTGTVQGGLQNSLFNSGMAFSITVARGETLGGDLTLDTANGANLTIQTGVNTFNLGSNKLILSDKTPTSNSNGVTVVSGSLTAADATVDFRNLTVVPANIFARSEVGSINFGADYNGSVAASHPEKVEIRGNVRVINALTITGHPTVDKLHIYTGNNKLTLLIPSDALDANHYVVGNLVMPVGNLNSAVFHVGSPADYTPVTMQLGPGSAATTTPEILASALNVDPTAGRGGNANNSINQTWTIAPQADFTDSLLLEFSFPGASTDAAKLGITDPENQFLSGNTFAAKWEEGHWRDYRTVINVLATNPLPNRVSGTLNRYSVIGSAALAGPWAVFAANTNTDAAKNDAISITKNKIVVTELATPVTTGISFAMTIALQDQYSQPIITENDLPVTVEFTNGNLIFAEGVGGKIAATIPAGQSTVEVRLQVDNTATTSNSPVAQIKVSADGDEGANWTPAITDYFPVIPAAPSNQAYDLTFTRATYTDVKVTWTNGDGANVLIIAKANGSLVIPDEMPRNGVTYVPNMVYGAGSNIGDAVVLYNGPANGLDVKQSMDVAGLIPSTTYTLYAFAYNGTRGEESYNISSAQRNPNSFSTSDGDDDDIAFGGRPHSNDSIVVSSTVGTNAPITGRVADGADYDCFNFTVTDEAPNVRVLLTNVPGDYTLELYDFTGRRIRRSTLLETSDEALVVNNLPAGTFVVKVFPMAANAEIGEYRLLINTFSSEIFSVTPAPNME